MPYVYIFVSSFARHQIDAASKWRPIQTRKLKLSTESKCHRFYICFFVFVFHEIICIYKCFCEYTSMSVCSTPHVLRRLISFYFSLCCIFILSFFNCCLFYWLFCCRGLPLSFPKMFLFRNCLLYHSFFSSFSS